MKQVPVAEWHKALARMESALADAAAVLESRDAESTASPGGPEEALDQPAYLAAIERRLAEWTTRLHAVEEAIARDEEVLTEQAGALDRWRVLFARWENLLQREQSVSPVA